MIAITTTNDGRIKTEYTNIFKISIFTLINANIISIATRKIKLKIIVVMIVKKILANKSNFFFLKYKKNNCEAQRQKLNTHKDIVR